MVKKQPDTRILGEDSVLKRFWKLIMDHFFRTFLVLVILNVFLIFIWRPVPLGITLVSFSVMILYVVLFLINHIGVNVQKLLHHELKLKEILAGYVTSVIFIILLFSILYLLMAALGIGYLKYGSCVDNVEVTHELIANDPLHVDELLHYPYFSTMTFFTVGYGDICPMGVSKLVAMLDAVVGNAFTVLILAIALTNYSTNKVKKE